MEEYDTIVISGGSTKGMVSLGAIQYAFDNYLLKKVKTYVGTSSGAIICYLLIIGYTPIEIMVYICTNQILESMLEFDVVSMAQGKGALSFNRLHEHLEKMTISKIGYLPTIGDLRERYNKDLICVTYNITEDMSEYMAPDTHADFPCLTALRMSANLPLIFEKYRYGNSLYVDGGICDNFPINFADSIGKKILGFLSVPEDTCGVTDDCSLLEYVYHLISVPINQNIEYKLSTLSDKCKIINLSYKSYKFFKFDIPPHVKLDMFSRGYNQFKEQI